MQARLQDTQERHMRQPLRHTTLSKEQLTLFRTPLLCTAHIADPQKFVREALEAFAVLLIHIPCSPAA